MRSETGLELGEAGAPDRDRLPGIVEQMDPANARRADDHHGPIDPRVGRRATSKTGVRRLDDDRDIRANQQDEQAPHLGQRRRPRHRKNVTRRGTKAAAIAQRVVIAREKVAATDDGTKVDQQASARGHPHSSSTISNVTPTAFMPRTKLPFSARVSGRQT